jgi:hypothetical protein
MATDSVRIQALSDWSNQRVCLIQRRVMNGLQEALHNAEQVRPPCVRGDGVDDWLAWW